MLGIFIPPRHVLCFSGSATITISPLFKYNTFMGQQGGKKKTHSDTSHENLKTRHFCGSHESRRATSSVFPMNKMDWVFFFLYLKEQGWNDPKALGSDCLASLATLCLGSDSAIRKPFKMKSDIC